MLNLRALLAIWAAGLFFAHGSCAQGVDTMQLTGPTLSPVSDSAQTARIPLTQRIGDTLIANLNAPLVSKPLSWKAVVIPTALIGYGTFAYTSDWGRNINLLGRSFASDDGDPDRKTNLDDYTLYVPAVAVLGLHIGGVRGRNNLVDATLIYAVSSGIANGLVMPLKHFTSSNRPDSSDLRSFPSGHTSTAFVSAEFLRQEYKDVSPWIGAAGYSVAILTGYLRMYNNKHWFSDVAAGAGIGIISTRLTYWLYPKLKNFVVQKTGARSGSTLVMPLYGDGYVGLRIARTF